MTSKEQIFIGIDISKHKLDLCIHQEGKKDVFCELKNEPNAIKKFFTRYNSEVVLVGVENTGRYNYPLNFVFRKLNTKLFIIPPLQLKASLGIARGKSDKIDSKRIVEYLRKNIDDLQQWRPASMDLERIKLLLAERQQKTKLIRQLSPNMKELEMIQDVGISEMMDKHCKAVIAVLKEQIKEIEKSINSIIINNTELREISKYITSVPGVGKVLCWMLLVKTNAFQSFSSARKLACFAGVVPFDYSSGTSVHRRSRVSYLSDKTLKTVLHLAALRAVRMPNDLQIYYEKKVKEGKNKMSVLNAVRNKIVHRVFSVVKNKKMYEKNLIMS